MAKKKIAAKSTELDAKEFFAAISDIEKEKGIPKSYMLEKITLALVAAYSPHSPHSDFRVRNRRKCSDAYLTPPPTSRSRPLPNRLSA